MPRTRRAPPLPRAERRRAIVDAVAPLLVARGAAVTTRQMAAAAGVAEGTLFSVFEDKRALVLAVLEDRMDPEPLTRALTAVDADAPLAAKLAAAADVVLARIDEIRALAAILQGLPRSAPGRAASPAAHLEAWAGAVRAGLTALIAPDAARLRLAPERLATHFASLLFASRPPWTATSHPIDVGELVDLTLHGAFRDAAIGAP